MGHDREELLGDKLEELNTLYLAPLFKIFQANSGEIYPGYRDLFYLWIDIKFSGEKVFELLQKEIMPYTEIFYHRENNPGGKVQIIISGDRPFEKIFEENSGYLFLDGRPSDLNEEYGSEIMPFISEDFRKLCDLDSSGILTSGQLEELRSLVELAHMGGYEVRFWATPEKKRLWKQLMDIGVDLINTDNLASLSSYMNDRS